MNEWGFQCQAVDLWWKLGCCAQLVSQGVTGGGDQDGTGGGQFWWWCGWTAVPRSFLPSLEMSCPSGAWLTECRKCRGRDRNCGFSDNFACWNGPFPVSWWADDKSNSKYTTLPALTSPFCLSCLCLEAGLASPREILVYPWTGL